MGWLYTFEHDKERFLNDILRPSLNYCIVDKAVRGNEVYALMESKTDGLRFISVLLISKARGEGWGYKEMDEAMAPYYYNCPARILDASTCTSESAVAWRQACRDKAAAKRSALKMVDILPGYAFTFNRKTYITEYTVQRGWKRVTTYWVAREEGTSSKYRFTISQMQNKAERNPEIV